MRGLVRRSAVRAALMWSLLAVLVALVPQSLQRADAASTAARRLEGDLRALIANGKRIYLLARVQTASQQRVVADEVMAEPYRFSRYITNQGLQIPLHRLRDAYRRAVVEELFPRDRPTRIGWHHRVTYADGSRDGGESLWRISEWFTGTGTNYKSIASYNNRNPNRALRLGDELVIPDHLLLPAFRLGPPPGPPRPATPPPPKAPEPYEPGTFPHPAIQNGELTFHEDPEGTYAAYELKRGETLYSSVVIRFTGRVEYREVMDTARAVAARSGIRDVSSIPPGRTIKIPIDLLSPEFRPPDDPVRRAHEADEEVASSYFNPVRSQHLRGITIVLDSGHGGKDPGAIGPNNTYEDEVCYDIVMRVKRILESETSADVHALVKDQSQGWAISDRTWFTNDEDEILLTTPAYNMAYPKTAVNLRWYLANSIYRRALARGASPDEVLFASFHADALHPAVYGAMVYIPGARYARGVNGKSGRVYTRRAEVREQQYVNISYADRVMHEGRSRNFGRLFVNSLRRQRLPVHHDDPIREFIYRGRGKWVPAVIRQNIIPTKVLIESVNLKNVQDAERVRDPRFRQQLARAFVDAVLDYYDATGETEARRVAQTP